MRGGAGPGAFPPPPGPAAPRRRPARPPARRGAAQCGGPPEEAEASPPPPAVVLDACVLYPTVLREVLLAVAAAELFVPLWSARILEEWALAAGRHLGPGAESEARAEIAAARAAFPRAEVAPPAAAAPVAGLPDPGDDHVVAAAGAGRADAIITRNLGDFPPRALRPRGLRALHPDPFLLALWQARPAAVAAAAGGVLARARAAGLGPSAGAILKRAGLPRLARALGRAGGAG